MERQIINPWRWQDEYGFVQANEVSDAQRVLYCAGQVSVDAEGNPLHPGDMGAQIAQSLDNLETVLESAGFAVSHGPAYTLGHSMTLRVGAGFQTRSAPTYALRAPP